MATTQTPAALGEEFVAALASRDFDRLERTFAPEIDFHAVVPGTGSFREQAGAEATADQFQKWFGECDPLDVLESSVTPIVDKLRIDYRLAAFEEGAWNVVEQTAYAKIGEHGIEKLDLACSGFRPVEADPR
jgi:SnoaL-like domain